MMTRSTVDVKNVFPVISMVTRGRTVGQGMSCMNPAVTSATLIPEGRRMSQEMVYTLEKLARVYTRKVLNISGMPLTLTRKVI